MPAATDDEISRLRGDMTGVLGTNAIQVWRTPPEDAGGKIGPPEHTATLSGGRILPPGNVAALSPALQGILAGGRASLIGFFAAGADLCEGDELRRSGRTYKVEGLETYDTLTVGALSETRAP